MRINLHLYYYLFIFPFVLFDHYLYICGRVGRGYDFEWCILYECKLCTHMWISWLSLFLHRLHTGINTRNNYNFHQTYGMEKFKKYITNNVKNISECSIAEIGTLGKGKSYDRPLAPLGTYHMISLSLVFLFRDRALKNIFKV